MGGNPQNTPKRIETFDAPVDSGTTQTPTQPPSLDSARITADTAILYDELNAIQPPQTPTLNDVVDESERRSVFSSVNFAGIIQGDDDQSHQSGAIKDESGVIPHASEAEREEKEGDSETPLSTTIIASDTDDAGSAMHINLPPSPQRVPSARFIRSVNRPMEEKPLLDEIREVLAQSYLCFLLADLRLMSGTGEIVTKYENVAVDSDFLPRNTAEHIAGLSEYSLGHCKGLSPVVIMAILILEIRDTFAMTAEEKAKTMKGDKKKIEYATSVDIDTEDRFVGYEHNKTKKKLTEESMKSLMRCYSRLVSEDLVTAIPNVRRRRTTMNLLDNKDRVDVPASPGGFQKIRSSFSTFESASRRRLETMSRRSWQSTRGVSDTAAAPTAPTGPTAPSSRTLVPVREETESELLVGNEVKEDDSKDDDEDDGPLRSPPHLVQSTGDIPDASLEEKEESEDGRRSFFSPRKSSQLINSTQGTPGQQLPSLRETMALSKQKSKLIADKIRKDLNDQAENFLPANREGRTQQEFEELTSAFFDQGCNNEELKSSLGATYTRKELVEVMRDAVATRNDARLQFLSKFFKDGSISKLLVESHSRIVWMNDWYPLKELTYIIAVDKLQERVMVVFRGAITPQDWKSALNYKFHDIRNPVKDDYEGKSERLRVISGIYKYLFRQRKDTKTTKYDEIANICHLYGMKYIGPHYKLFVTGHSLGGALTHFFSFFASTEERFTQSGPVRAIAFASPYMGSHSWADSIRHQEQCQKLQLVQCRNHDDAIPRVPLNFFIGKRGPLWRHVGIGVTLPSLPSKCCRRRWKPTVHYWGKEKSCMASTIHAYRRNVIFHIPYLRPWALNRSHTLLELQDRLIYGEQNSEQGGDFELLQSSLDELYGKLDEHDFQTLKTTRRWWGDKAARNS